MISSEQKLPVFLRFTYHEEDKEIAEGLYNKVVEDIQNKVKKCFILNI